LGPGGAAADLYALGVTLLQAATGEGGGRPEEILAGAREKAFALVIQRACAKEPSQRFARARDMLEALEAIAPPETSGSARVPEPRPPTARRWWLWLVAGAIVVLGVGVLSSLPRSTGPVLDPPGGAAPSTPAAEPLTIISMHLAQYRVGFDRPMGMIGIDSTGARFNEDSVSVLVRFSAPAYCYVVALNPNGVTQLCYPAEEDVPPQASDEVDAPTGRDGEPNVFGLTDGIGAQAFAVVASRSPLPAYSQWKAKAGQLPWRSFEIDGVWTSDGQQVRRLGGQRGEIRSRPGTPDIFAASVAALKGAPGIESVMAVAFPVRAGEHSPANGGTAPEAPGGPW
jgi:hypothetical protein